MNEQDRQREEALRQANSEARRAEESRRLEEQRREEERRRAGQLAVLAGWFGWT